LPESPTEPERLELLHEDQHIVVVNKPAWWVVHPTRGARDAITVLRILRDQLGQRVFPVHRLDRQASGVLVMARSSEAAARLADDIREGRWTKRYLGLCRGVLQDGRRIDHPVPEGDVRRPALTHIDPRRVFCDRYTLVQAMPTTGRRHQIRYHLKHVSHPLIGDANYGQGTINRFFRATFGLERLFLHAEWLRLPHPTENLLLELSCPLAPELEQVLERLARYRGAVP
jgi:tRNA pseudouridine65 synthase